MDVVKKNYKVEVPEYEVPNNIIMCKIEDALNWCRSRSFWPLTFGLACCAFEMMAAGDARYDIARFGSEVFRPSPRQCDLLIIAGTVTKKWSRLWFVCMNKWPNRNT